jgi:hypothetical protein
MRLLIFWIACLSLSYGTTHEFKFISYKENGLSKKFMEMLIDIFQPDVFFETGTYDGQTILNASEYFKKAITVEIHPPLFAEVQSKFLEHPNIESYLGNSSELIARVGGQLEGTVLFWLDAHYSGKGTGMTHSANSGSAEAITPIREELRAISDAGMGDCVILIDDIRGFGTQVYGHTFLGCWAYPTLQEVKVALLKINPHFEIALLGDILLAYDASKYFPNFSPAVQACTRTRLYDGYDLKDEELEDLGKKIQSATPSERLFIEQMYNMMSVYNDPMFWHDVWYLLIQTGQERKVQCLSESAFNRIRSVTDEVNVQKVFQSIGKIWQSRRE